MNPPIYGDTFREFVVIDFPMHFNETLNENELLRWNLYQYGCCTLFVIAGCIVVCPLLQKRNYKSKQRQKILVVDGMSLVFCLLRTISLLFAFGHGNVGTGCVLFLWAAGTAVLITTLAVFLFILWSTTKLEPMLWHIKNTFIIAGIVAVNLILVTCKEVAVSFSFSTTVHTFMTNLLLCSSLVNGASFLIISICFCGTFKKMTRNRRPSIRLVRDSNKRRKIQTKVVHTDVENFNSMVRKLRVIALLTLFLFGFNSYINIKLTILLNFPKTSHLSDVEIFSIEMSVRIMEISIIILIFCVGFFSPQHKEAAMQWIRSLSQSRSHEELSVKRTYSFDSCQDTAFDAKGRSGTLDCYNNDLSNGCSEDVIMMKDPKVSESLCADSLISSSLKQDSNYLMVPNSLSSKEFHSG